MPNLKPNGQGDAYWKAYMAGRKNSLTVKGKGRRDRSQGYWNGLYNLWWWILNLGVTFTHIKPFKKSYTLPLGPNPPLKTSLLRPCTVYQYHPGHFVLLSPWISILIKDWKSTELVKDNTDMTDIVFKFNATSATSDALLHDLIWNSNRNHRIHVGTRPASVVGLGVISKILAVPQAKLGCSWNEIRRLAFHQEQEGGRWGGIALQMVPRIMAAGRIFRANYTVPAVSQKHADTLAVWTTTPVRPGSGTLKKT